MTKVEEKPHIIRLKEPAVIERPMVLIPVEEYEELLEDAEIAKSRSLAKEIEKARKQFIKGKGRLLEEVLSDIESSKT